MIISGFTKIMQQKLPVIQVFLMKPTIKRLTITMAEFTSPVPKTVDVKNQHFRMCGDKVAGSGLRR